MAKVSPGSARATITEEPRGLRIVIPARRNPFLILFLGGWLMAWAFGEIAAAQSVLAGLGFEFQGPFNVQGSKDGLLFMAGWLLAWTAGGALAIVAWLWTVAGREIVTATDGTLTIKRSVLGRGPTREHEMAHVCAMRVAAEPFNPWDTQGLLRFWGMGGGPIAFDYGARTSRFGTALDEAEARQIVARLTARFHIPDDAPAAGP